MKQASFHIVRLAFVCGRSDDGASTGRSATQMHCLRRGSKVGLWGASGDDLRNALIPLPNLSNGNARGPT